MLQNTLPIDLEHQTFTQGTTDLFKQASALVSVSGSAAGVASDIMQSGEVLDFDLFTSDPTGFTNLAPTARASEIFMVFDGVGVTTDMVVILKLVDPDTNVHITKAIVVDAGDIFRQGDIIPGGFPTLDNNDGLIIIQSNDYNFGSENWLIEGGQVLSSTEGVIGANLIDFTRAIGPAGASVDGTRDFGALTTDGDNFKIANMGFATASTQDADLTFTVANVDADGDATAAQTLNVTIEGSHTFEGTASAESIQGTAGNDILIGREGADIMGRGGNDAINTGAADDDFQGIIRYTEASDFGTTGDVVSNFDATGASLAAEDRIEFGGANTAYDDIGLDDDVLAFASDNNANDDNQAVDLDITAEALFLDGLNSEGVTNAELGNATAVATEFSAEFAITASAGQDALLVVNGTGGNAFSLWQYVELTGATGGAGEISVSELSFIGVFSGNGAVQTGNLDLAYADAVTNVQLVVSLIYKPLSVDLRGQDSMSFACD